MVMQVLIGTLLSLLLVTYAPLGRLSTYLASLGIVMLIVVLLESRRMLNDFLLFKVRFCATLRPAHNCSSLESLSLFQHVSDLGIAGNILQIDYNNIASGIMGLHLSEELDETMNRAASLDDTYSSGHSSTTLDFATKTATYASSSPSQLVSRSCLVCSTAFQCFAVCSASHSAIASFSSFVQCHFSRPPTRPGHLGLLYLCS